VGVDGVLRHETKQFSVEVLCAKRIWLEFFVGRENYVFNLVSSFMTREHQLIAEAM